MLLLWIIPNEKLILSGQSGKYAIFNEFYLKIDAILQNSQRIWYKLEIAATLLKPISAGFQVINTQNVFQWVCNSTYKR